ncbi:hypothetical protein GCM10018952_51190 [Streptosporangium vulgare]
MSRVATLRASTAGGRRGRFATFGDTRTVEVTAATTDSSVHVSRNRAWYGWSCTVTRSRPAWSESRASATTLSAWSALGVRKVPNSSSCP